MKELNESLVSFPYYSYFNSTNPIIQLLSVIKVQELNLNFYNLVTYAYCRDHFVWGRYIFHFV